MIVVYFVMWLVGIAINSSPSGTLVRGLGAGLIASGAVGFALTWYSCGVHP